MIDLASTGIKGLDKILQGLKLGDNVVWQVDSIDDYRHFVAPYLVRAKADGKNIVYIRFAQHPPLVENDPQIKTYQLSALTGFESFSKQVHDIITAEGEGAFYLFDCLSDLLSAWATDLMIGNFFLVTCPYLFKLRTIAYFALLRNYHSFKTIARIRETTQLLLDIYDLDGRFYVHPLKVWDRYSPTMFLPHQEEGENYFPLTNSVDVTKLFTYMSDKGAESANRNLDNWDRLFLRAEEIAREGELGGEREAMADQLCRIMLGREPRMMALVKRYFTLEDLIEIKSKMIGSGFIGGKALGMLLARKILQPEWQEKLEPHDSFYIGSDVFYTYIVQNGWWNLWLEQKTDAGYFAKASDLKEKLLSGSFPDEIKEQFNGMLEYFGQSPIIVRSSSLLEDGFGNAFAGKYESLFCVNQGTPEVRYTNYENTVKRVFASTMNEDALTYRRQRGLGQQDEQMALLVMRVSGNQYRQSFLPYLAGVGVSYNTFVWHENMDAKAGMLRLVFGLGTRAVNRVEGDYPRIVALDAPLLKPYGMEDNKKFSQHDVDLLNIVTNELESAELNQLLRDEPGLKVERVGKRGLGTGGEGWVLTFDEFLAKTGFTKDMSGILKLLETTYQYPVDVEFTVNFTAEGEAKINLLQCRPLQAKGETGQVKLPDKLDPKKTFFSAHGSFMGGSVNQPITRLVYVDPAGYRELLFQKKFSVARLIGRLNRLGGEKQPTMLIGPGRWGTRDATLGVPVSFAEINNFAALVETADKTSGFMPELSFGSHFFLDLVEGNIFYVALFPENEGVLFNRGWLAKEKNILAELLPDAAELAKVVKVFDLSKKPLRLLSDVASQKVICEL